ncbi:alanine racemase [bacterium (Candidatus Blackallbacteria) CG17_big_fil_post_rev_8_21_14_2_50_48_46]|uniref:Alanine racemase n=1 Tax=bacterium (Candidatus Blackallbacteria) CG17_big_fil_post_rev_8_21_14_2_50_48_46 TaxID=2014261 RepID=A0A2M7G1G1_9BACT|nr:MAG: alanine racemase [bacterium (Candidatus Blackallbacteria) CG18_big_fil_WC_8_21_14_2_50_49_26]PIW15557.1 MAG: alanine racemase [bacterium (Candidatus Blackallbacteria) CG17_big_fil_post_rev_8_21_14_2_50_48_46]PIW49348.1 MAG: alanine racemase [bacterium (Candidatus Blackallbacteria) CG13_big_fil_rev_8_21_14_2_50_49_14]
MIVTSLPRKYYSKWTEIDLSALEHNLKRLQNACQPASAQIMAVVKANAYGHNVSQIAPALFQQGITHYGVATLGEALHLKQLLPQAEHILILGALSVSQYRLALEEGFALMLHTLAHLPILEDLARAIGRPAEAHLKVDTGMGRVGILPTEMGAALDQLALTEWVNLRGICSHLATSDRPACPHIHRQIQIFNEVLSYARSHLREPEALIYHLANSDAVFQYPEAHYNLVRPGISLYGYGGAQGTGLKPVLALKAQITQLKDVPAGTALGYGRSFITARPSRIGVIALGYADGLNRLLSNQQEILVKGQRLPLVGRISMDQCTVDLTDLQQTIEVGETVTFIGQEGDETITAQDWADKIGTIPYEVLTGLGTRLPRWAAE